MPESGVTTDGQADRVPETRTERTRRHPTVRSLYQRNGEKPAATGEAKTDGDEPTTESDGSTPDDASFSTDADETFADGQQPADAKAAMDVEISTEQKTEPSMTLAWAGRRSSTCGTQCDSGKYGSIRRSCLSVSQAQIIHGGSLLSPVNQIDPAL